METQSQDFEKRLNELESFQEKISNQWLFSGFWKRCFSIFGYCFVANVIVYISIMIICSFVLAITSGW